MRQRSRTTLRFWLGLFAAALALLGSWQIAAEFVRPQIPYWPEGPSSAEDAAQQRGRAALAARIGAVRGDLYVDYAISLAPVPFIDLSVASSGAEDASRKAARLAPSDARAWLLVALTARRRDATERTITEAVKMSYYTGPNEAALIPARLLIATRSAAIADPDLADLAKRDLRTIVIRRPDLRPALFAAYNRASPEGKQFLEAEVGSLDPQLVADLRSTSAPR